MGNSAGSSQTGQYTTQGLMSDYSAYLPSILNSVNQSQAQQDVSNAYLSNMLTQSYSNTGLSNLLNYANAYAGVGNSIQNQNALAGANTNLQQIAGPGWQTAQVANALQQSINPEYYGVRTGAAQQALNLVNSVNLNGLSGGEQAAVERSLAGSNYAAGQLGVDNATNAVGNAMNFGDYMNTKRTALGSALNTATGFMNAANNTSTWNPVSTALSQPDASTNENWGTSQFSGVTKATGTNASTLSSDYLSALSGIYNNALTGANTSTYQNSAQGNAVAVGNASGTSSCCFIFLEAYHGTLPWWVRECRDSFYRQAPQIADGYKRMAKWLVPAMQKSSMVRWLVWRMMVSPITKYGGWLAEVPKYKDCQRYKTIRNVWFKVWGWMGSNKTI